MVLPFLDTDDAHEPDITLYADGGTICGSPGTRGVYWSIGSEEGPKYRGEDTTGKLRRSEEAEFQAFIEACKHLKNVCERGDRAIIMTDCETVGHHVKERKIPRKNRRLRALCEEAYMLLMEMRFLGVSVTVQKTRREQVLAVLGH